MDGSVAVVNELLSLAQGPDLRVMRYPSCIVNGVKFLIQDRDKRRKCQNSGVCVEGEHDGNVMDFFGVLTEILELTYKGDKSVVMFKCEWFDGLRFRRDKFFTSINFKKKWYDSEPYVLAIQASQVFFVPDTKEKGDWHVLQRVDHRHIWDSCLFETSSEEAHIDENYEEGSVYQQSECPTEVVDIEELENPQLDREDEDPEIVEIRGGFIGRDRADLINDEHLEVIWELDVDNDNEENSCSSLDIDEDPNF